MPLVLAWGLWDGVTVTRHLIGKLMGDSKFVAIVGESAC